MALLLVRTLQRMHVLVCLLSLIILGSFGAPTVENSDRVQTILYLFHGGSSVDSANITRFEGFEIQAIVFLFHTRCLGNLTGEKVHEIKRQWPALHTLVCTLKLLFHTANRY